MYPYRSHPSRTHLRAAQAHATSTEPGQHRQRRPIDPASVSLEGVPSLIQIGREIGVMVVICLGIAVAGGLYAHLFAGH